MDGFRLKKKTYRIYKLYLRDYTQLTKRRRKKSTFLWQGTVCRMRQMKTEKVNIQLNDLMETSWKQGSSFQVEKLVSPLLNEQFIIHVYIRDACPNFQQQKTPTRKRNIILIEIFVSCNVRLWREWIKREKFYVWISRKHILDKHVQNHIKWRVVIKS